MITTLRKIKDHVKSLFTKDEYECDECDWGDDGIWKEYNSEVKKLAAFKKVKVGDVYIEPDFGEKLVVTYKDDTGLAGVYDNGDVHRFYAEDWAGYNYELSSRNKRVILSVGN